MSTDEEKFQEAMNQFNIEEYLTDLLVFNALIKSNGAIVITEEDIEKINEMRKTRMIEFTSDKSEEGMSITARFVYMEEEDGEGNKDE